MIQIKVVLYVGLPHPHFFDCSVGWWGGQSVQYNAEPFSVAGTW
jgi:hypothetical protein